MVKASRVSLVLQAKVRVPVDRTCCRVVGYLHRQHMPPTMATMATQLEQQTHMYLRVLGETLEDACQRLGITGVAAFTQLTREEARDVHAALRRRAKRLQRDRLDRERKATERAAREEAHRQALRMRSTEQRTVSERIAFNTEHRKAWSSDRITAKQRAFLAALPMSTLMSLAERLCGLEGVTSPNQLTKGQASEIITHVKRYE